MTRQDTPADRAREVAWASNRPAPRAEPVLPRRSRAAAMAGARSGPQGGETIAVCQPEQLKSLVLDRIDYS